MRFATLALLTPLILPALATPSLADVTHAVETRFGVGYSSNQNQRHGGLQSLYSGRYTSTFSHEADNGYVFRFELGIGVGNMPTRPSVSYERPQPRTAPRTE